MRILLVVLGVAVSLLVFASPVQNKMIYGLNETMRLEEMGLSLPAKLDTGAESASLSARNIKVFEQDGQMMVKFDLAINDKHRKAWGLDAQQGNGAVYPLSHHVRIKRRADSISAGEKDFSRRPVITLTLCVGQRRSPVDVNLTDRSNFDYPLLVGAEGLRNLKGLVDPALSQVAGEPSCRPEETHGNKHMTEDVEAQSWDQ